MRLSKHFTLAEMTKSHYAERHNIDNSLNPELQGQTVANLEHLCECVLEPIRAHFGKPIVPSSGYRCPELNRAIGGSPKSQHMDGEAVDIEIPGVRNVDLAYWIALNLTFDQLILECYSEDDPTAGWVHVSFRRQGGNRQDVRTIGRTVSTEGLPKP